LGVISKRRVVGVDLFPKSLPLVFLDGPGENRLQRLAGLRSQLPQRLMRFHVDPYG
jgi:hypothetical protein